MQKLIALVKETLLKKVDLPFCVYSSNHVQNILNVPVVKPLLIVVLDGEKNLGQENEIVCSAGSFIFLSDSPSINMRNIPKDKEYFALLIDFEYQDFEGVHLAKSSNIPFCLGQVTAELEKSLQQFVEWSCFSPKEMWPLRRKEIIQLLYYLGHKDILSMVTTTKVGVKLHAILSAKPAEEIAINDICDQLAMSESTLRRKLKAEDTTIQEIKDQVRLGLGLHLLQTTTISIALIAEQCGYLSQSRFTDRFKGRFGITPSQLRKTKLLDD